ncbi:MAG TPA: DUF2726 domain-containing protein [Chloroflexia bacterium]|nr:DUF2726 domain-containing protein [Chloroflexia bacterium]
MIDRWSEPTQPVRLPFARENALLSADEQALYDALYRAVGRDRRIFSHVRLAELVSPEEGARDALPDFDRLAGLHVDFVLCDRDSLTPRVVVELDRAGALDPAHVDPSPLVDAVLRSAGLPVVRVPVAPYYDAAMLARLVAGALGVEPHLPDTQPLPAGHAAYVPPIPAAEDLTPTAPAPVIEIEPARKPRRQANRQANRPMPSRPARRPRRIVPRWVKRFVFRLTLLALVVAGAAAAYVMVDWRSLVPQFTLPSLPEITLPRPPWESGNTPATPGLTGNRPIATVNSAGLNMRAGPGSDYESVAAYERGTRVEVLARDEAGEWLKVTAPDGNTGWMSAHFLAVEGGLEGVPVERAPPAP